MPLDAHLPRSEIFPVFSWISKSGLTRTHTYTYWVCVCVCVCTCVCIDQNRDEGACNALPCRPHNLTAGHGLTLVFDDTDTILVSKESQMSLMEAVQRVRQGQTIEVSLTSSAKPQPPGPTLQTRDPELFDKDLRVILSSSGFCARLVCLCWTVRYHGACGDIGHDRCNDCF
jgi:hypothetical protein